MTTTGDQKRYEQLVPFLADLDRIASSGPDGSGYDERLFKLACSILKTELRAHELLDRAVAIRDKGDGI